MQRSKKDRYSITSSAVANSEETSSYLVGAYTGQP
jgi:hypothetical protein